MSTRQEREAVVARAQQAWDRVAGVFAERGETWPATDIGSWGPGLRLGMCEFRAIAEVSALIGGPGFDGLIARFQDGEQD